MSRAHDIATRSYAPKRFLRQLLRRYLVRIQFRLLGFPVNDVVDDGNVTDGLGEILRWLGGARRRAVHRLVSAQYRPGELAETSNARRSDLRDRFGSRERGRRSRRERRRRGAATRRGIYVQYRVHAATTRHASLILGILLGVKDLQAPVSPAQEMSDLFHRGTVHLSVRFDLRTNQSGHL